MSTSLNPNYVVLLKLVDLKEIITWVREALPKVTFAAVAHSEYFTAFLC